MTIPSNRIHSLDALRAIMMLLGIVLHSSETYSVGYDEVWPKDPKATHVFFNYLSSIIHIFRMPIFFMISGFFAAMLFYDRSPRAMIVQRFKRIVLPFIVFLLLLHPIIFYSMRLMIDTFGLKTFPGVMFRWLPGITYHLWFLYYLIIITAIAFVMAMALNRSLPLRQLIRRIFESLLRKQWLFILILSMLLFALLVWMWDYWAPTPLGFIPDIKLIVFYSLFYFFGWLLFVSRDMLSQLLKYDRLFVVTATLIYTLKFIFSDSIDDVLYGGLNTVVGCFYLFGFTGLFLRYFNDHSQLRRYLSDASYWVYLIHLPFTLLFPALIANCDTMAGIKFMTVLTGTTIVCFVSYHYLVRSTFVGQFLNGRKYD